MENTTTPSATSTAHTPTPWDVDIHGDNWGVYIVAQAQSQLQAMFDSDKEVENREAYRVDEANARFIERACNAHADLLSLAGSFRDSCSDRINILEEDLAAEHEFGGDAADVRSQIAHWKAYCGECDTVLAKAKSNAS